MWSAWLVRAGSPSWGAGSWPGVPERIVLRRRGQGWAASDRPAPAARGGEALDHRAVGKHTGKPWEISRSESPGR
ncbi:hypothetical protein VXQ18_15130 [Brucella abortus]|nr:hypothetical protein [Brucella abortus]